MPRLSFSLLGGFQARLASGPIFTLPTRKAQALLAYLALRPGQAHPRDKLAALLWGDTGEEQARHSLRQTLFALRKALPATKPPSLLIEGQTLTLNPSAVEVDVAAFERLVAEGTPEALQQAAALYQGDLLEGLDPKEAPFEEWLLAERERLRELALGALARLLAHQTKTGATEGAIQTVVRLLALDPLQETVHRALMRLYNRQGRRGAALRQYQVCVGVLQRELGVEPEVETKQLYQEILQRRPARPATTEAPPVRPTRRPRRGSTRSRPGAPPTEAPLIGREPELARLRQALGETWQGRGQTVAVLGEAGIGKSRLIDELVADALQRGGRVLLGRSYETEQILPFGPWVDALRTGQVVSDVELLEGLSPVWRAELAWLLPELGEPGPPLSTAAENYLRLFEAVTQLVAHLASRQPLLLILEDLHWADEMSLRLLSFLGRRMQTWAVLVVGTAREEELAGAPLLRHLLQELDREQRLVQLMLSPLSRSDTVTLVGALARTGSEESTVARLGEQVWAVSEGNPFMVVETMRALREGRSPQAPSGLPLPQRVREVIAGRLERLSERGQQLVALAAVIGREFDFALLQRAAGLSEPEAAGGVEELVRRRVLQGVGERFDFTHDRIREVASDQLLPPRRKLLHGLVAKALEELYAENLEPHYAALGVHYREGEVWGKALAYLRQAGAQAFARSAYREAVACFEQALVALQHLPVSRETVEQAIDLRLDLRNSLFPLGEFGPILEHLREAETLAKAVGNQPRLGQVYSYMTNYYLAVYDHARAIESGQRALIIAAALGEFALEVATNFYLGQVYASLGDYRRAIDSNRRIVTSIQGDPVRQRSGQSSLLAFSRTWLVWCLAELGEFAEGIARGEEGVRVAEAVDQPFDRILAYLGVGLLHLRKGDLHSAIPVLERGLQLCQSGNLPVWFPAIASPLGYAYALSGRIAEAIPLLERAAEESTSMRGVGHALRVAHLSEAYLLASRTEDASELALRALDLSRDHKERGHQAYALRLLGEIASYRDPPEVEKAEEYYRQAIALADELGMRPLLAHGHLGLGALYGQIRRVEQARSELSAAIELFRSMEMTFWLTRAETALAKGE